MGVLNVTPDSFSDGGRFFSVDDAVRHALSMVEERADIIDIGGESSRPGSDRVPSEEQIRRVIPVIETLKKCISVPISIDTPDPKVAHRALEAGVSIVNDITGLTNGAMIDVVRKAECRVVIMHMQGDPKTMQQTPTYGDVVGDILRFFQERIEVATMHGIHDIILDPGIGFGKTVEHTLEILRRLREFTIFGFPLLVGVSRKSFLGAITGLPVHERLPPTIAANTLAIAHGASILRVHDVGTCRKAADIADAILGYKTEM